MRPVATRSPLQDAVPVPLLAPSTPQFSQPHDLLTGVAVDDGGDKRGQRRKCVCLFLTVAVSVIHARHTVDGMTQDSLSNIGSHASTNS